MCSVLLVDRKFSPIDWDVGGVLWACKTRRSSTIATYSEEASEREVREKEDHGKYE